MQNRHIHTLTAEDVGKIRLNVAGRYIDVGSALGTVQPADVGKRLYAVARCQADRLADQYHGPERPTIQAENADQLARRRAADVRAAEDAAALAYSDHRRAADAVKEARDRLTAAALATDGSPHAWLAADIRAAALAAVNGRRQRRTPTQEPKK